MSSLVAFSSARSSAPVPKRGERSSARFGEKNARLTSHGHAARGGFPAASRARFTSVSLAAPDSSNVSTDVSTDVSLEDQLGAAAQRSAPSVVRAPEPPSFPRAPAEPTKTTRKRASQRPPPLKPAGRARLRTPGADGGGRRGRAAASPRRRRGPGAHRAGPCSFVEGRRAERQRRALPDREDRERERDGGESETLFEQMVTLRTRLNERLAASAISLPSFWSSRCNRESGDTATAN